MPTARLPLSHHVAPSSFHHHASTHPSAASHKTAALAAHKRAAPVHGSSSRPVSVSDCLWQTGCCNRHPISCRDTSQLKVASQPSTCPGCCAGEPVYTRPGRVGSKWTLEYLHGTEPGCAQWGAFHDVLASQLPAHQSKVTVLREPCSRARSLLTHWHQQFPASHPIQRVANMSQLARFMTTNWPQMMRRPWPMQDAALHHYIVGWPQAWYIDGCTRVLCFERVGAELHDYCAARRRGISALNTSSTFETPQREAAKAKKGSDPGILAEPGCAEIRALFPRDAALHDRHCLGRRA
jgi:hypothetical protein